MTNECSLVIVSGSPSKASRSERLGNYVGSQLVAKGLKVDHLKIRNLPAEALVHGNLSDLSIKDALSAVGSATGLIFVTPTYKGTYSGLLKLFIDLLPQHAFQDKIILPLAMGGTLAHLLMLDYGLRPTLQTMRPRNIVQGCFVLDSHLTLSDTGACQLNEVVAPILDDVIEDFCRALHRH